MGYFAAVESPGSTRQRQRALINRQLGDSSGGCKYLVVGFLELSQRRREKRKAP